MKRVIFILLILNTELFAQEISLDSHHWMIDKLDKITKAERLDEYGVDNSSNIYKIKNKINTETDSLELKYMFEKLALNYLIRGNIDSAWFVYNSSLASFGNYYFEKGITQFRKAEVNNCLKYHNNESCILPFSQNAQHKNKSDATTAISYFIKSLQEDEKYQSKWMLNIANMALGLYPKNIPRKYLIDFYKFQATDKNLKKFNDIGAQTGVDHLTYYGGASIEDFNNDGYLDIFSTSGNETNNVRLFINNKNGFDDNTLIAGLTGITGGVNVIHADFNNDGCNDIYIMRGGWMKKDAHLFLNSLLKNNCDGTFSDITLNTGLLNYGASHTACFRDINHDGYLDLFIGYENTPSKLFLNNGNETFTEISNTAGVILTEFIKGSVWLDYNNDGWDDLYISVYGGNNHLFKNNGLNQQKQITFTDVAKELNVTNPKGSFSVAAFDFNNDGYEDIYVPTFFIGNYTNTIQNFEGKLNTTDPNMLYINNFTDSFIPKKNTNLYNRCFFPMSVNFFDANNDGWLDIYNGTGYPDFDALIPNILFLNDKKANITENTFQAGLGHLQKTHGIAAGDIDNDGDQDLYANIGGFYISDNFVNCLFKNNTEVQKYVTIKCIGVKSNKSAIGTRIKLGLTNIQNKNDTLNLYRTVNTGGSYGSSALQVQIDFEKKYFINTIEIYWPASGIKQVFKNIKSNSRFIDNEFAKELILIPE